MPFVMTSIPLIKVLDCFKESPLDTVLSVLICIFLALYTENLHTL